MVLWIPKSQTRTVGTEGLNPAAGHCAAAGRRHEIPIWLKGMAHGM